MLLGIGRSGHIGFNEPGSPRESRTHLVFLDSITRADAASDFFGEENVPLEAITMGVASIMDAREIALLATGEHKAGIVRTGRGGGCPPGCGRHLPARLTPTPPSTSISPPAADLTRVATPWLLGEVEWTPPPGNGGRDLAQPAGGAVHPSPVHEGLPGQPPLLPHGQASGLPRR